MEKIIVKSQEDWDNVPTDFKGYVYIDAPDNAKIIITENKGSSTIARGRSLVEVRNSTRVTAKDNTKVEARDTSKIKAWDNTTVEARDTSKIKVWNSAQVETRDKSRSVYFR